MADRNPKIDLRVYACWAVVEAAPDLKGKWVAHCLEFDTLAQADDPEGAMELLIEITTDIVLDDLRSGMNPLDRRAPSDDDGWSLLKQVVEDANAQRFSSYDDATAAAQAMSPDLGEAVFLVQFGLIYARGSNSQRLAPEPVTKPFQLVVPDRSEAYAV